MLMDRAYEGNETPQLLLDLGMIPVVPPKSNRLHLWDYDHAAYKKRSEIERLFRRRKGFRRIFSRFEKLDALFLGFLSFALIVLMRDFPCRLRCGDHVFNYIRLRLGVSVHVRPVLRCKLAFCLFISSSVVGVPAQTVPKR